MSNQTKTQEKSDLDYMLAHCLSEFEVEQAKKRPEGERFEYLRKRTVDAAQMGYYKPGPFYFTGDGVIVLCDKLSPKINIRSYKITDVVREALARE